VPRTLGDIAAALQLQLHGDAAVPIEALAPIDQAGANDLSFVVGPAFRQALELTSAAAVILPAQLLDAAPSAALVAKNPYLAYAKASWLLTAEQRPPVGIHPTALVDESARIGDRVAIGAYSVIGAGVTIGDDVAIGDHCALGAQSHIGNRCRLFDRVTVNSRVTLGRECRVQSGAVLGSEGFGFAPDFDSDTTLWQPIQQTGVVQIGDHVHIGANTTIDRGAMAATVIGNGVILDNQIQIAHNVTIGDNTAIAGCAGIAGSTVIGERCRIGGACNIVGHLTIADDVMLCAASLVTQSIDAAGEYGSGVPLQKGAAWRRTFAALSRLDNLRKRVTRLEQRGPSNNSGEGV